MRRFLLTLAFALSLTSAQAQISQPSSQAGTLVSITVLNGSAVSLTTATPANVTTAFSLNAGTWLVCGQVSFNPGTTTSITEVIGWISDQSATLPTGSVTTRPVHRLDMAAVVPGVSGAVYLPTGCAVLQPTAATTYYLSAQANFSVSTLTVFGTIQGIRLF